MVRPDIVLLYLMLVFGYSYITYGLLTPPEKWNRSERAFELPTFSDCPHGYVRFAESCYIAAHSIANWPEAMVYCKAYAAHLAFVDSDDEQAFLARYLKNISTMSTDPMHDFWIGGTDAVSEGEWIWSKVARPVTYTNWGPGQPDNDVSHESKHQDCMAINATTGEWHDGWCESDHNFVCELDLYESNGLSVIG